jgi:formylglycine-generating enzyme required for sulfatase activity
VIASYDELEHYASWMNCRLPTFEEAKGIYAHSVRLKESLLYGAPDGLSNGTTNGQRFSSHLHTIDSNSSNLTASSRTVTKATTNRPSTGYTKAPQPVQPPTASSSPVFIDLANKNTSFKHWHPTPVIQSGDKLAGHADFGGVWEWTSSPLTEHEGFKAMEIYQGYTCEFCSFFLFLTTWISL